MLVKDLVNNNIFDLISNGALSEVGLQLFTNDKDEIEKVIITYKPHDKLNVSCETFK